MLLACAAIAVLIGSALALVFVAVLTPNVSFLGAPLMDGLYAGVDWALLGAVVLGSGIAATTRWTGWRSSARSSYVVGEHPGAEFIVDASTLPQAEPLTLVSSNGGVLRVHPPGEEARALRLGETSTVALGEMEFEVRMVSLEAGPAARSELDWRLLGYCAIVPAAVWALQQMTGFLETDIDIAPESIEVAMAVSADPRIPTAALVPSGAPSLGPRRAPEHEAVEPAQAAPARSPEPTPTEPSLAPAPAPEPPRAATRTRKKPKKSGRRGRKASKPQKKAGTRVSLAVSANNADLDDPRLVTHTKPLLAAPRIPASKDPLGLTRVDPTLAVSNIPLSGGLRVVEVTPTVAAPGTMVEIRVAKGVRLDARTVRVATGDATWGIREVRGARILAMVPEGAQAGPLTVSVGSSSVQTDTRFGVLGRGNELTPPSPTYHGLIGEVFSIGHRFTMLPAISSLGKPDATVVVTHLDVPKRAWLTGFPGLHESIIEWFVVRFQGSIEIPKAGEYRFCLHSDDGSKLLLQGKRLIDNDGIHGMTMKCASTMLPRGRQRLRIDYFQGPRQHIGLQLLWAPPGQPMVPVPTEVLWRPGAPS